MSKIVFASHTARSAVFRIGSHHYSKQLADVGHEVFHVSTPVSLTHLARLKDVNVRRRLRQAALSSPGYIDGVRQIVPLTAFPITRASPRVSAQLVSKAYFAGGIKPLRHPDVLIIDQPGLASLVRLLEPKMAIYRPTDTHEAGVLGQMERELLPLVDGVVATSAHVLEKLGDAANLLPSLVLENGVDYDHFAYSDDDHGEHRSGVVYVGSLDARFNWESVNEMAASQPQETFTLIGPLPKGPTPMLRSNVRAIGPVPYSELPGYLLKAKVGLLPLTNTAVNLGRSPMKFYEYLAAGLNVVASKTPTLSARNASGVYLYDDRRSMESELQSALARPVPNEEGRALARKYSWSARTETLLSFIDGLR